MAASLGDDLDCDNDLRTSPTFYSKYDLTLSHEPKETVFTGLILLEGEITLTRNVIALKSNETDLTIGKKYSSLTSDFQAPDLLIHHDGRCHSWPLVEGRFKAFVKLSKGLNVIKIQFQEVQKELKIFREGMSVERRFVRIVYIKCCDGDGSFDAPVDIDNTLNRAVEKLQFNALLMQTFMAEEMKRHGFGPQTFQVEETDNGDVKVHVFTSKLTTQEAHAMNGDQLYKAFLKELQSSSLNDKNCKFLAFMSCTHYDPPQTNLRPQDVHLYVKGHTALGGGQLGLFGTGGLHTWASSVEMLLSCFTNTKIIDKTKLFDDSNRRGTYWANYSTTLGAALHELGHCFDLMHSPQGIMSRGFDDMNKFVVVTSSSRDCSPPTNGGDNEEALVSAMRMFVDHKAHWFRSSAVLLHYHQWLNHGVETSFVKTDCKYPLYINWSDGVKGPIGNGGGSAASQLYFDDVMWHMSHDLEQSGYLIYHEEYINAIVPLAGHVHLEESPVYGNVDSQCSQHIFTLEKDEYLISIDVRAGAWIDAIRFHSNMKSSIWFGGKGGDLYEMSSPVGVRIVGIVGTFGQYLGSVGVVLNTGTKSEPYVISEVGLGLVELRREEELLNFWEFVHDDVPPQEFYLPELWRRSVENYDDVNIMAVDIAGNILRSSFFGYEEFRGNLDILMGQESENIE